MGTTRVRLTLELEINGDIPADACTYFIGRFGNYAGESLEAPVEDQVEQVILDVLDHNWPELLRTWRARWVQSEGAGSSVVRFRTTNHAWKELRWTTGNRQGSRLTSRSRR